MLQGPQVRETVKADGKGKCNGQKLQRVVRAAARVVAVVIATGDSKGRREGDGHI